MTPTPNKYQEHQNYRKASRTRRPTECSVKRRSYDGCGICGSLNAVKQGVVYCYKCGEESDFMDGNWEENYRSVKCSCRITFGKGKYRRFSRPINSISVVKCTDCGAVQGPFCPNCKKHSDMCWRHWDGRLYCKACGFRREAT